MAAIPTSSGGARLPVPAITILVTVVYVAGAAVALVLGSPAQGAAGLAVLAVTAARLAGLRAARTRGGAGPWS